MNRLCAGFARLDATPMLGIGLSGYYVERRAEAVLDALEVNALALSCGQTRAVLVSVDNCGLTDKETMRRCVRQVCEATGLAPEAIVIAATHTHTGPLWQEDAQDERAAEYARALRRRIADAAKLALCDLRPARLGCATAWAPRLAFARRFRMKDGSIRTNPGVGNPDILEAIGEVDERAHVLRFARERAPEIVLVNFGNHPDAVGGSVISADWPGFVRRGVERVYPGVRCVFFNGAQGDVNHVNVRPAPGETNDLHPDFDDVDRGYGHARHIGDALAGAVMQCYAKAAWQEVERLACAQRTIRVPANVPTPQQVARAREYARLHREGRDDQIPFRGMELTTAVAEAERMLRLEHGPKQFEMALSAVAVGEVALVGMPGEPFTGIGRALKQAPGWRMVMPLCIANGYEGYFPMREAYDEGGYEARSSIFKAGVAELIVAEGRALLEQLRGRM